VAWVISLVAQNITLWRKTTFSPPFCGLLYDGISQATECTMIGWWIIENIWRWSHLRYGPELARMNWGKPWQPSDMVVVIAKNCPRFLNKVPSIEWNEVSSNNSFSNMCNLHHSNSFQERDYPHKRMGKWTVCGARESRPYSEILMEIIIIIFWI